MKLSYHLQNWIKKQNFDSRPLLIGYSGGIDSQALLHLIFLALENKSQLHVVHVDHAVREDSEHQAAVLKSYVENLGLVFHHERLDLMEETVKCNIEDFLRQKRYEVFSRIYHKIQAQALILAHQKQDVEETTFKRLFEGASFFKIIGLRDSSYINHMKVLRPFLDVSKEELKKYLEEHQIFYLHDKTNDDPKFFRNRQRLTMFPYIEQQFGKKCISHLGKLREKIFQMEHYFSEKIALKEGFKKGPFGKAAALGALSNLHPLELEYLLRKELEELFLRPNHQQVETLIGLVKEKKQGKKVEIGSYSCFLEKNSLFIVKQTKPQTFDLNLSFKDLPFHFETESYLWTIKRASPLDSPHSPWEGVFSLELVDTPFAFISSAKRAVSSNCPKILTDQIPLVAQGDSVSNPWIKKTKSLKEGYGMRLICRPKNLYEGDLYGLKSYPLVSSKS